MTKLSVALAQALTPIAPEKMVRRPTNKEHPRAEDVEALSDVLYGTFFARALENSRKRR